MANPSTKNYFIVGLGRFGLALCERLSALGQYVIAVDSNMERVEEIAPTVAYAACLDGTDQEALINAGAREADVAVIAIGQDLDSSILCTAIMKELEVKTVVSRAQTALHARVLSKVGATRVIFPERDLGIRLADSFANRWLTGLHRLGGAYSVAELKPLPEMTGKPLSVLNFRQSYNVTILLFERQGEQIFPEPDTVLTHDDLLYVVGQTCDLTQWAEQLDRSKGDKS